MTINIVRLNWFIYESDINILGGAVTYTGRTIVRSYRSSVKEAVVTLGNNSITVFMECFRDGTAVICNFTQNGKSVAKNTAEAERFLELYRTMRNQRENFVEFVFVRTIKQILTFLLQIFCIFSIFHVGYSFFYLPQIINLLFVAEGIVAVFLFIFCTKQYSCHRKMRFDAYVSILED